MYLGRLWRDVRLFGGLALRLACLMWEASPHYALLALLVVVLSAAVLPAQIWISKIIIDRIMEEVSRPTAMADWRALLLPIGGIAAAWGLG